MITRTVAREIAVHYAFELGFSNLTAQELLEQELTQERFGEIAEIDPLYAEFPDEKQCAYIRKLVEEGRMEEAEEMLGMPYTLVGAVEHGNHIGHTLGFPTVNLLPPAGKLLPPNGVYYAAVRHNGKVYKAISNVGTKPTVSSEKVMGVESYLYDFDQDIYGQEIEVALKRFRRPERRFGSLEELKEQLDRDIADGRNA